MSRGERLFRWLLVLPALALLFFVTVFPTAFAYYMSLHRITIETFWRPVFVGINNFASVARNSEFWYSLWFTIMFMVVATSLEMLLGLGLAVLFQGRIRGKAVMLALILTPLGVAPALYGLMFRLMLDSVTGVIPALFSLIGVRFSPMASYPTMVLSLIAIDVLQWTPFVFLILYAALHSLPSEPLEAAVVDGASGWQVLRFVTLPLIKPAMVVAGLFRLMDAFKTFDIIYVITGGGPGISTSTASILIYKQTFLLGNFGLGAATTIFLFYISMALVTIIYRVIYGGGGQAS